MGIVEKVLALLRKEAVLYTVVGCITTVVNFVVFAAADFLLSGTRLPESVGYKVAYVLAFVVAVVFAYWSNKLWVFRNRDMAPGTLLREFASFLAARVFSGGVCFLMMIFMVDVCKHSHNFAWLCTTVFNMVFNYVASKWWIFKARGDRDV